MKNFLTARAKYIGLAILAAMIGGGLSSDAPVAPFVPALAAGIFGIALGVCGALAYFADHNDYVTGACLAFGTFFVGGVLSGSNKFVGGLVVGGIVGALGVVWWLHSDNEDLNN